MRQIITFSTNLLLIAILYLPTTVFASEDPPDRTEIVTRQVTEYQWWLVRWSDNQLLCEIYTDHEGLPTGREIYYFCGEEIYEEWEESEPCAEAEAREGADSCPGFYLHFVGSELVEREVVIQLPKPVLSISQVGCEPAGFGSRCRGTPTLLIEAQEPVTKEQILSIHVELEGERTSCEGDQCLLPLYGDYSNGVELEFWAMSSFGDESEHHTAFVRKILLSVGTEGRLWQVDVLSDVWRGSPLAACSLAWGAFTPVEGLPTWLTTPVDPMVLRSNDTYHILASQLLRWGITQAEDCPGGGLQADGSANACGVERARSDIDIWQDYFDHRIFDVAMEVGVPAQLLKNLFAQESQFWPGDHDEGLEFGLGRLHEQGGDALFLWNTPFYYEFCPSVLSEETCQTKYYELEESEQTLLRGALANVVDVRCPTCPGGMDLDKAEASVELFAQLLLANCEQVGQMVWNLTRERPGAVSSYEDLWRYTLVNYNAGPGCLAKALKKIYTFEMVEWEELSEALVELEACENAVRYVQRIAIDEKVYE